MKFLVIFVALFAIAPIPNGTSQEIPHQVQQFFQQYIVKPLEERVNKKVEEVSGIINHLINPSSNSSGSSNETHTQLPDISLTNSNNSLLTLLAPNKNNSSDSLDVSQLIVELLPSDKDKSTTVENTRDPKLSSPSQDSLPADAVVTLKGLCPELETSPDGLIKRDWRYFEPKNKCFRLGRRGPCGSNMTLYSQEVGSIYGFCDCLSLDDRMMIYDNETDACYPIFSKGICKEDEWIDLTRSGDPICTANPCEKNGTNYVWFKGTCVEVGTQSDKCKGTEVVGFVKMRRTPTCSNIQPTIQTGPAPCPPGSYQAIHGKCHVSEWDFGDED